MLRQQIIKVLQQKSHFSVVDKPEEGEFVIIYGSGAVQTGFSSFLNSTWINAAEIGDFVVAKRGDSMPNGDVRPRILWGHKRRGTGGVPGWFTKVKNPAAQLATDFLKAFEKETKKKT